VPGYLHAARVNCETLFIDAAETGSFIKISAWPAFFDFAIGKPLFFYTAFTAPFAQTFPFCEREIRFLQSNIKKEEKRGD